MVDAQSVKNADTAGTKGYDAGKKVSGIKRHIAVDTLGLPHAIAITPADVTDRTRGGCWRYPAGQSTSPKSGRCWWTGLYGQTLCRRRYQNHGGGRGRSRQAQRTAYLRGAAQTLGCGAFVRLVGEMPTALEKLRTSYQQLPTNG